MRRRIFAASAATLLALLGAVLLISYVHGADMRAQAGQQGVPVLVVDTTVPQGTSAQQLGSMVSLKSVPKRLVAPGSVDSLAALGDEVATANLLPGEQVVKDRFADSPGTSATADVPSGTQEVSVTLEPQRAVGGVLKAGDSVAVYLAGATTEQPALPDVLVTRVSGGTTSGGTDSGGAIAAAQSSAVTVTLALAPKDVPTVVNGMTAGQGGSLWLSLVGSPTTATISTTGANK